MTTYALTIHQPWAWAIVSGHKPVENRSWLPPIALMGKTFLVHASKAFDKSTLPTVRSLTGDRLPPCPDEAAAELALGAVLGAVRLVGCIDREGKRVLPELRLRDPRRAQQIRTSAWFVGPFGWVLDRPVRFEEPVPARGRQKLWPAPIGLVADCREQYRRAA